MTFTNKLHGYDPLGLVPKIVIKNAKTGATIYTYESKQIAASPTQDFDLESWNLHGGVNADHGHFEALIDDKDNLLTEVDDVRAKSKIKNQWKVEVSLGKRVASLNLWFTSFIHGVRLTRPSVNSQKFRLFAIGHSIRNHDRLINVSKFQNKLSNGEDLDPADNDAKISEIAKDLIGNAESYAYPLLPTEGFTTTGIDDIDIKLPNFQKRYRTLGTSLQDLANIAGAYFGVTPEGDVFLRRRGSAVSTMLITNDLDGLQWQNWPDAKKMILKNSPNWWEDATTDAGYPFLYGFGPQSITKDQEQTSANAALDLSSNYFAVPITLTKDNIIKVAPFLSKSGTPTRNLHVCIIGDDGAGAPNAADFRIRQDIAKERLIAELGSAKYFEIPFEKLFVEPNVQHYIYFEKYGDAANPISLDYQTGTGTYFDSPDGLVWTSRTGNVKLRTYHGRSMVIILENTISRKSFPDREAVVDMKDITEEDQGQLALIGLSDSLGKERRLYSGLEVTPPDDVIPLGKSVLIHDKFNDLTINADIIGYDIGSNAEPATKMNVSIEEFTY